MDRHFLADDTFAERYLYPANEKLLPDAARVIIFIERRLFSVDWGAIQMVAFVFPGQGSQKKGMGADLFERYPEHVKIADAILGYSIEEMCLLNPENKLSLTEHTQAAVFTVNALSYLDYVEKANITPDFVAGHSLGEYNALLAAKVFDFETGIKLVGMRGRLMGKATGGAMAAISGLSGEGVREICDMHPDLNLSVANYNTSVQIVISGMKENVMKSRAFFTAIDGVKFVPLNVSGAFHSPYMDQPSMEFERFVSSFTLKEPVIPVIANVSAREYKGHDLSQYLIKQMNSPVRWSDTIQYLMAKGVGHFVEMGQSAMLTKMIDGVRKSERARHSSKPDALT